MIVSGLLLATFLSPQEPELLLPARVAFLTPEANAGHRQQEGGLRDWRGQLHFFGELKSAGSFQVSALFSGEAAELADYLGKTPESWHLQLRGRSPAAPPEKIGSPLLQDLSGRLAADGKTLLFGPYTLEEKDLGYVELLLQHRGAAAEQEPTLQSLRLHGSAVSGAHFSQVERRNAASVHLAYEVPEKVREEVSWFYCELTPRTVPLWTYYEATGWHRGYFGMQVNSPTERRLIFSVWDAGGEAIDRAKVADSDLVQLVGKGEGVVASGFGHEGTGGHSHLVYDWEVDHTYRFLLHAEIEGESTVYSGWFYFPDRQAWGLIASFRAPHDGKSAHGLYSFNENFSGANGQLQRLCEFGNQWIGTEDGRWFPLTKARFTHDGHGKAERLDRSGGVLESEEGQAGDRFYLSNGGFRHDRNPFAVGDYGTGLERALGLGKAPTAEELATLQMPAPR